MYFPDLDEIQWQVIKKILNMQEKKRKYDLREMWNVVFYFVKKDCQSVCSLLFSFLVS